MIKGKEHTLPICAGCDNWKDGPDLGADLTTKLNAESIPPLDNN